MNDPVLHVIAVNPAVILNEVLSGDRPGVADVRSLPFITFAELMDGKWSGDASLVTGLHVENFSTIKVSIVRSLEKAQLDGLIVERFRYIHFTSINEAVSNATVHEERIEMSTFIDQYHSSYGAGSIHEAVQIPEPNVAASEEWNQDDHVF